MIILELVSGLILKYFVSCMFGERTGIYFFGGWCVFCYLIMAIAGFADLFSGTDQPFPIVWYMFLADTLGYGLIIWGIRRQMKEDFFNNQE